MKKLVEEVIESEEGYLGEMKALNLGSVQSASKLSAGAIEHLIGKLVEEKWLLRVSLKISR